METDILWSRASLLTLKTNIQKTWLTTKSCRLVSPNLRSIIKRALWTLWGNILQDAFRLPGRMWFQNKWNWRKSRSYLVSGEEEVLTKLWSWKSSVWSSRCMEDSSNFKTFRGGLKKISTYRTNLIISRTRMFNHASLALKLNVQNANGSTTDMQWFKLSFGVSFFYSLSTSYD